MFNQISEHTMSQPNWHINLTITLFICTFLSIRNTWYIFLLSILYILVYTCQSQSPNSSHHPPPPAFPPLVSIPLSSTSVSLFLLCKPVHLYHFSRFHIYVLIYDVCFSLSDLLHSVWQSLGPSTSLQMTQFRSFLWRIFHCIYVPHLLYPFVCWWAFRLLPWPGYCK